MKSHSRELMIYVGAMACLMLLIFLEVLLETSREFPVITLVLFVAWGVTGPTTLLALSKSQEDGVSFLRKTSLCLFSIITIIFVLFRFLEFQIFGWSFVKSILIFMVLCFIQYKLGKWFYCLVQHHNISPIL
jgi:hypothetical protein